MDLSQLQEKVSGNLRQVVSEKMKENEHGPLTHLDIGAPSAASGHPKIPLTPSEETRSQDKVKSSQSPRK